jgi:hypothetical protein
MSETVHLGLPAIAAAQAQKHVSHNEALRILDALVMLSVKDRDLSEPPESPADGDRYLVKPAGGGGFAGKDDQIAHFRDGAWTFHIPKSGWLCYVEDEETPLIYDGEAWVGLLGEHASFQNVTLLGIGTEADGTNPLSAKLNNVLWSARYESEGGDGCLRYTLNKEEPADVLSFLFQTDWSGRAEIGLTGSDNLQVKVSPDGSVWKDAVSVSNASGNVGIGGATDPVSPLHIGDANSAAVSSALITTDMMVISAQATAPGFNIIAVGSSAPHRGVFKATRARGTLSSPTAVETGDNTFSLLGAALDGTAQRATAGITFEVDGTVTDNVQAPQAIVFQTGAASRSERVRINSSGNMGIGTASPDEKLTVAGIIDPGADNTYTMGKSGRRWSAIWSANGTIQTSDARDKRDIAQSDLGLDFILALRPISYRFAVGGSEEVAETVDVEEDEQAFGEVQRTVAVIDLEDGRAVRRERVETVRVPLFDDIPVVDQAGRPVHDPAGTPLVHRVPRTVKVTRAQQVVGYRDRPGRRRHYGLSAQQVRKVLDDLGVEDFAGWVKTDPADPASDEALRYDQFIAPLIRAMQQLTERVAALEARLQ